MESKHYEVIIIGGSYAGLSAALALGRSLRKVLIIDSGTPCNRQTPHSHNFITKDGVAPGEIAALAKVQIQEYKTIDFVDDLALSAKQNERGFLISTKKGNEFSSGKVILATGLKDLIPEVKGFRECWGISLIHCPYCHGYEFKEKKTAIMANGERAFHLASLVSNLTDELTILTLGKAEFKPEQIVKLESNNISIIETKVFEIEHQDGYIQNLIFSNGRKVSFDAVYAGFPFEQQSDIPVSLGCELTEQGHIKVNEFQQSSVPGLYACGDNSIKMRSVANAVASGNLTGAMVNYELTQEQF